VGNLPGANAIRRARTYISTYGAEAFAHEAWSRVWRRLTNPDMPNRFHIEISNSCNLDCEYCVLREQATGDKVMSDETFAEILPYLRNSSSIALSGLAEPLMNRRFSSFLHQVREVAPNALISICTNASLLTPALARDMVAAKLGSFVFSLDGADSELVDGIRHGGSLDILIQKIRMLNEEKHKVHSKLPVLAATMVTQRKTIGQLPSVVELAATLEVKMVTINGLEPYKPELIDAALWTGRDTPREELIAAVEQASRVADDKGVSLRFPSLRPEAPRCPQMGRPVVLADGTVIPCSILAYRRDGFLAVDAHGALIDRHCYTDQVSFGNVNQRPLSEIWADADCREFRMPVTSGDFPAECDSCLLKHNVICANEPLSAREFIESLDGGI